MSPRQSPKGETLEGLTARDIKALEGLIRAKIETLKLTDRVNHTPVSLDLIICELALKGLSD
jgi:hypothetical protein